MKDEKIVFTKEMIVILEFTWDIANKEEGLQSGSLV